MKRFLVFSVVSLLLLVSVAKCEGDEEPETDAAGPTKVDLDDLDVAVESNSTTSRPKRQDIYTDPSAMGGGGMVASAMAGGFPGGPIGGGWPGGPISGGWPGGPISGGWPGGPISGGWPGGPISGGWPQGGSSGGGWPWDPCQPPSGCPRCSWIKSWDNWQCQQFCFSRKWCFCQW